MSYRLRYALKYGLVFAWAGFIWVLIYSGLTSLASLSNLPSALIAGLLTGVTAGPGSLRILAGDAVADDPRTFLRKIYSRENWIPNLLVFGVAGALFGLFLVYVALPSGLGSTRSVWSLSLRLCPALFLGFGIIGWVLEKPFR